MNNGKSAAGATLFIVHCSVLTGFIHFDITIATSRLFDKIVKVSQHRRPIIRREDLIDSFGRRGGWGMKRVRTALLTLLAGFLPALGSGCLNPLALGVLTPIPM